MVIKKKYHKFRDEFHTYDLDVLGSIPIGVEYSKFIAKHVNENIFNLMTPS